MAAEVWMRPCCLGLGHALDAMAAALVAQVLEDVVAGDAEDDFLVAALLAGAEGDVLDLPALVAGIVGVHVVEVAGEEGRLVAAGAGADFHDDAVEVLALGQEQVFQLAFAALAARPVSSAISSVPAAASRGRIPPRPAPRPASDRAGPVCIRDTA